MSSSEGSHILYGRLRTEQPLNWIHPWIQLVWSNKSAQIPMELSCGVWDIFPQWGGAFYVTATSALTSAECQCHTSSVWPWSGMPKVHLYYTFLGGLRHKHLRQNPSPASGPAVLLWDDDVASSPPQNLTQRSGLITCVASDLSQACQKYHCMVRCIIGLRHGPKKFSADVIALISTHLKVLLDWLSDLLDPSPPSLDFELVAPMLLSHHSHVTMWFDSWIVLALFFHPFVQMNDPIAWKPKLSLYIRRASLSSGLLSFL